LAASAFCWAVLFFAGAWLACAGAASWAMAAPQNRMAAMATGRLSLDSFLVFISVTPHQLNWIVFDRATQRARCAEGPLM